MNENQLKDYLKNLISEDKVSEAKIVLREDSWKTWAKAFCAFANTKDGHVFVGIDNNLKISGIEKEDVDRLVRHVNDILKVHTSPMVDYSLTKILLASGKIVLDFAIPFRPNTMTWFTEEKEPPISYVRREGESDIPTIEEMKNMIHRESPDFLDSTIVAVEKRDAGFSELEKAFAEANDNSILSDSDYKSFGLVSQDSDHLSLAGWLFSDRSTCPKANLVCRRWPSLTQGTDRCQDEKLYQDGLLGLLGSAIAYIKATPSYQFGDQKSEKGGAAIEKGSFSGIALQEGIINALAHRDYSIGANEIAIDCFPDRMQVTSPGSSSHFPNGSLPRFLSHETSFRRNPVICATFQECKLMQKRGSGFDRIIADYQSLGDRYFPMFSCTSVSFTLILKNKQYSFSPMESSSASSFNDALLSAPMFKEREKIFKENPKYRTLENMLSKNPNASYADIQDKLGISRDGVKYYIMAMKEACLIRRVGSNLRGSYQLVEDLDRPARFNALTPDEKQLAIQWCQTNFASSSSIEKEQGSLALKEILSKAINTPIDNGQFKGVMLLSGFKAENLSSLDWHFFIRREEAVVEN